MHAFLHRVARILAVGFDVMLLFVVVVVVVVVPSAVIFVPSAVVDDVVSKWLLSAMAARNSLD